MSDATLISIALVLTLIGGLAWFALTQWWTLVSAAYQQITGSTPASIEPQPENPTW